MKKYWLDQPRNVTRVYYALWVICVVLLLVDLLPGYDKHAHFRWENIFGFYGIFGFAVFFGVVLAGKELRKLLMRDEDYYDR